MFDDTKPPRLAFLKYEEQTTGRGADAPPTFVVEPGANGFYAVEVARDPLLFLSTSQAVRRYTHSQPEGRGEAANFFANWRTEPMQHSSTPRRQTLTGIGFTTRPGWFTPL